MLNGCPKINNTFLHLALTHPLCDVLFVTNLKVCPTKYLISDLIVQIT